ncbi:unnamed protein product [Adineta steineri]|uniref:Uncharacterized protein n=1 Tax=Adineta steineri TaxID=433720 RepID=A0A813WNL9_9BILA|nr:unnamed protein product [Adineta steineri]CAF1273644.1 unnamed protein product [Adineta steineri]
MVRAGGIAAAPILAGACILFIMFVIASTIVLALIPTYLTTKSIAKSSIAYYCTATYDGSLGSDGDLDATARAAFARSMEHTVHHPTDSISSDLIRAATTSTRRRKRGFALSRLNRGSVAGGIQRLYIRLNSVGLISVLKGTFTTSFLFNNVQQTPTLTYTCSRTPITFPPIISSSTSATTASPTSAMTG